MSPALHNPVARSTRPVVRFAWLVVFYNVLAIVWGAFVRASGSGDGCGDHWPLCKGKFIPVSPGFHTIIEYVHRLMTGGGDTILVLALLIWTFRATAKGSAARMFAVASTILLVMEALLGALLVKLGYVGADQSVGRMVVLSIHLSNTLIMLGSMTLTARFLSTGQSRAGLHRAPCFGWGVAGLAATIAVGVSGSMAALGDTLFPATSLHAAYIEDITASSPALLRLRFIHPLSALLAAIFVVWLIVRSRRSNLPVRRPEARTRLARLVVGLICLQFCLGIADVLLLAPAWMQLLHLLGADLFWVALVLLAAETLWPTAEPVPALV